MKNCSILIGCAKTVTPDKITHRNWLKDNRIFLQPMISCKTMTEISCGNVEERNGFNKDQTHTGLEINSKLDEKTRMILPRLIKRMVTFGIITENYNVLATDLCKNMARWFVSDAGILA